MPSPSRRAALLAVFLTALPGLPTAAPADTPAATKYLPFPTDGLTHAATRHGRSVIPQDAFVARIAAGQWADPAAGQDGWKPLQGNAEGVFSQAPPGGYAAFTVTADAPRTAILEASGHQMVYVNGEPRAGDIYQNGYVHLPVALKAGANAFLFHVGRPPLKVRLAEPKGPAQLHLGDVTVPDLRVGEAIDHQVAVIVLNNTPAPLTALALEATPADGPATRTALPVIPPTTLRKVAFTVKGPAPAEPGTRAVRLRLIDGTGAALDAAALNLRVCKPEETYRRTFVSTIDGSLQYYAVVPRAKDHGPEAPALFLTLHGASVEALGQAQCYAPKKAGYVVAPTNRRPYGFDWEDWGRLDALEVLAEARRAFATDPRKTYLTGHSMGGHGTWHLGATYPDHFAAIGPSAGWISMYSYAGARKDTNPTPAQELLLRAAAPSDTLALARNYAQEAIYVLHGDKDDNVPVGQARQMKEVLSAFHKDFQYHEQPGAGHWWGNQCVDWAPIFELFAGRTLPERRAVARVEFATASPGVSARCHWAVIADQLQRHLVSTVALSQDVAGRRFSGTTANVARLGLDVGHLEPGLPVAVALDGEDLGPQPWPAAAVLWLERSAGRWKAAAAPPPGHKGPQRYGPFKEAFRNRMVFVHGTRGSPAENAWSYARARFDAETFWYRGNGAVEVVADTAFAAAAARDRNVIVYGHAGMNGAWPALLGDSPVQVTAGKLRVGDRELAGDDLACLFLRPKAGTADALVGVVAGTGLHGLRLTDRLPVFVSGTGFPDLLAFGPDALEKGSAAVRVAGFFGGDWGVPTGEFAWRE